MIQYSRNARSRLTEETDRRRKEAEVQTSKENAKKRAAAERRELEAKRAKVLAEADAIDEQIKALK